MITAGTVVVPARDEQAVIGACLDSVLAARAHVQRERGVPIDVVVVLDVCRDGTRGVVARYPDVCVLEAYDGSVGAARRIGAARVPDDPQHWLASTDADCRVPIDWLLRMVSHADDGADLVLGTVRPDALPEAVRLAWIAAHHLGDGHRHVHGANLGIRGSTHAAAGGWPPLPAHEDAGLVARVEQLAGVHVRRCGDVVVETSSRTHGRAPDGFAGYLANLADGLPQPRAG
ncbi:glycosyltransferase [uncultured Jatrophihabitans sp.]|uniref:glycosyltransferase n=1 Tax=uncultured Jatrophihabitans sp. TaxID=1610747 RepID=UPI0035CB35B5